MVEVRCGDDLQELHHGSDFAPAHDADRDSVVLRLVGRGVDGAWGAVREADAADHRHVLARASAEADRRGGGPQRADEHPGSGCHKGLRRSASHLPHKDGERSLAERIRELVRIIRRVELELQKVAEVDDSNAFGLPEAGDRRVLLSDPCLSAGASDNLGELRSSELRIALPPWASAEDEGRWARKGIAEPTGGQ